MALSGWSKAWPKGDPGAAKPLHMKSTFNTKRQLKLADPEAGTEAHEEKFKFTVEFQFSRLLTLG